MDRSSDVRVCLVGDRSGVCVCVCVCRLGEGYVGGCGSITDVCPCVCAPVWVVVVVLRMCAPVCVCVTLRALFSGTFLQTLPDLVTPLKGH